MVARSATFLLCFQVSLVFGTASADAGDQVSAVLGGAGDTQRLAELSGKEKLFG